MVDITAVPHAMSSLKVAKDIAEAMIGLRDAAVFQEKRLELQSKIINAQSSIFEVNEERSALLKVISDLEKEIANMKTREAEKQRYKLKQISPVVSMAYALKIGMEKGEPSHHICANCYQSGRKSILQGTPQLALGRRVHLCPQCKIEITVEKSEAFNASP